ncbi:MAG: SRPBCC family protein [Candidatus Dormibacteria bacterium]
MRIESSFTVAAAPDRVFAYLLEVNQVVGCLPGAELSEIVDSQTFRGKLKIKVGAVQVTYQGTARIVDMVEDDASATVTIEGEGREVGGQGSVRAKLLLTVAGTAEGGSEVRLESDLTVTGRVAQFGRGVIEDVSRRLIGQMGECIGTRLQAAPAG